MQISAPLKKNLHSSFQGCESLTFEFLCSWSVENKHLTNSSSILISSGWPQTRERPQKLSSKQRLAHFGRIRSAVAGLEWIQRRSTLRSQHCIVDGSTEHEHMRCNQPARLDQHRRHRFQEAISDRCRSGYDHGLGCHHSICR